MRGITKLVIASGLFGAVFAGLATYGALTDLGELPRPLHNYEVHVGYQRIDVTAIVSKEGTLDDAVRAVLEASGQPIRELAAVAYNDVAETRAREPAIRAPVYVSGGASVVCFLAVAYLLALNRHSSQKARS